MVYHCQNGLIWSKYKQLSRPVLHKDMQIPISLSIATMKILPYVLASNFANVHQGLPSLWDSLQLFQLKH